MFVEYVKQAFIEFAAESMMVPWIYLSFNQEFVGGPNSNSSEQLSELKNKSMNQSKIGSYMALGTSTNVNKSAIAAQQEGLDDSVMDEEDKNIEV